MLLSLDHLVMVDWWELCLLPQSGLPPLEEGDPLEVSLSNYGAPCLLCHLLLLSTHWEQVFFCSVPQLPTSSILTSSLEASSSKPNIHSLMLYAAAGVQFVFVVPEGHPGHWPYFSFPWWHLQWLNDLPGQYSPSFPPKSLLAQLTGLPKQNPTTLVSPRGSPSLNNHWPKNKIASPGAKTTASVICSSRPSWNMLAITELVQAWRHEGWSPPPSPKVTLTWMK